MIDILSGRRQPSVWQLCFFVLIALCSLGAAWFTRAHAAPGDDPAPTLDHHVYLTGVLHRARVSYTHWMYAPLAQRDPPPCPTTSAAQWHTIAPSQHFITGAAGSPDLNLNVRGWYPVSEPLTFTIYAFPGGEPPDHEYPLFLSSVVPGAREAAFAAAYQVNDWDWTGCNCSRPRNPYPYPVTMLGLRAAPGQPVRMPGRNAPLDRRNVIAMVLYADAEQVALKYTLEDRVDTGYLVHLRDFCVDPNLVALYRHLDAAGRWELPAVYNDSVVGVVHGGAVSVVVRDSGSFMDPRSQQDWWQDQPAPARPRP